MQVWNYHMSAEFRIVDAVELVGESEIVAELLQQVDTETRTALSHVSQRLAGRITFPIRQSSQMNRSLNESRQFHLD